MICQNDTLALLLNDHDDFNVFVTFFVLPGYAKICFSALTGALCAYTTFPKYSGGFEPLEQRLEQARPR